MSDERVQFRPGDKVLYPGRGKVKIENIREESAGGRRQQFLVFDRGGALALEAADTVGIRPVLNDGQIYAVFKILRGQPSLKTNEDPLSFSYQKFLDRIKAGKIFELAAILRDIYACRKNKCCFSGIHVFVDPKKLQAIFVTGLNLLAREIASSQGLEEGDVRARIEVELAK